MLKKSSKKRNALIVLGINICLISILAISYAWFLVRLNGLFFIPDVVIGSEDIVVVESFVVNVTRKNKNSETNLGMKQYDPYIQTNNVNTNAIFVLKLQVQNIDTLVLRLDKIPLSEMGENISENSLTVSDTCYLQILCETLAYNDTDLLYDTLSTKFASASYPKYYTFDAGQIGYVPHYAFAVTSSTLTLAINFDYDELKIVNFLGASGSYSLANLGSIPFINNFKLLISGV